jgi:hypothetical protein
LFDIRVFDTSIALQAPPGGHGLTTPAHLAHIEIAWPALRERRIG